MAETESTKQFIFISFLFTELKAVHHPETLGMFLTRADCQCSGILPLVQNSTAASRTGRLLAGWSVVYRA